VRRVSGAPSRWLFHQITDKNYDYTPAAPGRDEDAETFVEVRGGVDKMTYARFRRLMAETGLHLAQLIFGKTQGDSNRP
jgi:hypothetical protein